MVSFVGLPFIGIAADRSGSMDKMAHEVRSGINAFVKDQLEVGDAHLHVSQFDCYVEDVYSGLLSKAPEFNSSHFVPRGMTALHDAMYHLIMAAEKAENEKVESADTESSKSNDIKPIIVVFTDGYENTSKNCSSLQLKGLVSEKRTAGWKFIFMGCEDVVSSASTMGLQRSECHAYEATPEGQYTALRTASAEITRTRTQSV